MSLSPEERVTLTVVGALALTGLLVLLWQGQRPPLRVEGSPTPVQAVRWDEALAASRQVDINTASAAELERLPEIGQGLAKRIVEYRRLHGRFATPKDLMHVRGIGPKKYQVLKEYIIAK